jgi:hypothetical protein
MTITTFIMTMVTVMMCPVLAYSPQALFLNCRVEYRAKPYWVAGAGHNNLAHR